MIQAQTWRGLVAALAGVLLLVGCSAGPKRPEVIAHRGASGDAPENTLAAIEGAIALGCDRVEVDVRVTRDGVPVLFHDESLERTTDGTGLLERTTLAQLRELDAGSWKGPQWSGEGVPTLEEAARACNGRIKLMLDIKVDGQADAIAAAVRATGIPDRDVIAGVWHDPQVRALLPKRGEVTLAFIGEAPEGSGGKWMNLLYWTGFRAVSLGWPTVTPRIMNAGYQRDMAIYVWTLNEAEEMRQAIELDVAGILTDDPALLLRVMAEGETP